MPLCGWNNDMSRGVRSFVMGLSAQTKKRALEEGVSITEIPAIELAEIEILLKELSASQQKDQFKGIVGIIILVQFLYMQLAERFEEVECDVDSVFSEFADTLNAQLETMDAHYYQNLRPNYSRFEAIVRIREFLESQINK